MPAHEVAFQVLKGTKVEVNNFFHFPLIRTVEEIMTQFRARNREEEVMIGLFRMGIPDYSEQSVREAFLNAIIHRDYQRLGAVHFQWYEDKIEISNPGGFVEGVTLNNLLVTPPRPRNPRLADVFKRIGLVERTGRGIDTIFEGQLRYGRPIPDYGRTTEDNVMIILRGGKANLDFCKWVVEQEKAGYVQMRGFEPIQQQEMIVQYLRAHRHIKRSEVAELCKLSPDQAKRLLQKLVKANKLIQYGKGKGTRYELKSLNTGEPIYMGS